MWKEMPRAYGAGPVNLLAYKTSRFKLKIYRPLTKHKLPIIIKSILNPNQVTTVPPIIAPIAILK